MLRTSKSVEPNTLRLPSLSNGTGDNSAAQQQHLLAPPLGSARSAGGRLRSSSCKAAHGSVKSSISGLTLGLDVHKEVSRPKGHRETHDWSKLLANSGIRSDGWSVHKPQSYNARVELGQEKEPMVGLSTQHSHENANAVCRALESPSQRILKQVGAKAGDKATPRRRGAATRMDSATPNTARDSRRRAGRNVNASEDGTSPASPESDMDRLHGDDYPSPVSPQRGATRPAGPDEDETGLGEGRMRERMAAKRFEATLSSFQELVNSENIPMGIPEALERLKPFAGGGNFAWERNARWGNGYGAHVNINFQVILWYHNWNQPDEKTRISSKVSFLHKPGCAYIYQPCLPVTSLVISPRQSFRPMFDMDPRSFHTFKLAWRHFLDFGVSDYRIIVGEQLEQWTQRCKAVIEKPLNAVYWLMLMVGSHYREALVKRNVLHAYTECFERVPVICVDSFVALSALLFCPERQVLYAGTDPTPSYLQWLQYIADQHSRRKEASHRKPDRSTVFEMNEFLDLSVIIVFYGRIQQKVKESKPLSWVGNAALIKTYIAQYAEDNRCSTQLEQAVRLYCYSSALGEHRTSAVGEDPAWYCWNGLHICEIGVPMPCTQATFLSPFTLTKPVALLCPVHGPDADRLAAEAKEQAAEAKERKKDQKEHSSNISKDSTDTPSKRASAETIFGMRPSRPASVGSLQSFPSGSGLSGINTTTSDSSGSGSEWDMFTESQDSNFAGGAKEDAELEGECKNCSCMRYLRGISDGQKKGARRKHPGQDSMDPEMVHVLRSVGPYDLMHSFIAVLAGCLNHAKLVVRSHFSIDPKAYQHLPVRQKMSWPEAMIPWYREFHKPDAHGRSRYGMLLQSVVRGLLGDGYMSGLHDEVLDIVRVQDTVNELEAKSKESSFHIKPVPGADPGSPTSPMVQKHVAIDLKGLRRPSHLFGVPGAGRSASLCHVASSGSVRYSLPKEDTNEEQVAQQPSGVMSPPALIHAAQKQTPIHNPQRQILAIKGVISDIVLWTELYESESLYNFRGHFDNFHQWCHAAHLIPFLKRCYRRSGIAGLLPGQRCGGGPKEADPSFPLVMPTIPNFHYGQCYPFHRVLEYFYGGMDVIVASIDDASVQESARTQWKLIPGQDRLNNLCWFQLAQSQLEVFMQMQSFFEPDSVRQSMAPTSPLNRLLLQQLEDSQSARQSTVQPPITMERSRSGSNGTNLDMSFLDNLKQPHKYGVRPARSSKHHRSTVSQAPAVGSAVELKQARKMTQLSRATLKSKRSDIKHLQGKIAGDGKGKRKAAQIARIGIMAHDDPFFWFCSHNFALYVYPADYIPKHFLSDGSSLVYHYADFVSRTGTPDPAHKAADGGSSKRPTSGHWARSSASSVLSQGGVDNLLDRLEPDAEDHSEDHIVVDGKVVPPSICLCQPTDLSQHTRKRWVIGQEFIDDRTLILGDSGFFPGALGMRFSYEVKTEDVDRYICLSAMPQAQLLYIEHQLVPVKVKAKEKNKLSKPKDKPDVDEDSVSSWSSDSDDDTDLKNGRRYDTSASRKRHMRERQAEERRLKEEEETLKEGQSIMLPPLLGTKNGFRI